MSTEKELFSAGISKCEKILKILLPDDVFRIKEIDSCIKSLSNQNQQKTKGRRHEEIKRKKSCVPSLEMKCSEVSKKDLLFLNTLTEKLTSQREGTKNTKKIVKVVETMQDYINNKEKLIKNLK